MYVGELINNKYKSHFLNAAGKFNLSYNLYKT